MTLDAAITRVAAHIEAERAAGGAGSAASIEQIAAVSYDRDPAFPPGKGSSRRVICLDDNRLFDSASEAVRVLGLPRSRFTQNLAGDIPGIDGRAFSYLDKWCPNPE